MRTASGGHINGSTAEFTLDDIALGLSRQPRFGGQARRHWTVLLHSLTAYYIGHRYLASRFSEHHISKYDRLLRLVLMHDAHEAFIGDVPATLKTPDREALEQTLDVFVSTAVCLAPPLPAESRFVKWCDVQALHAEGELYGPQCSEYWFPSEIALDVASTVGFVYQDASTDPHAIATFKGINELHVRSNSRIRNMAVGSSQAVAPGGPVGGRSSSSLDTLYQTPTSATPFCLDS